MVFTTLIIEDNLSFRRSLVELLASGFPGMRISEAGDAAQGYAQVKAWPPNLVIVDIRLPGENGLELTKKLKRDFPSLPVVILTSHDLPEYREAAGQYGADFFLTKGTLTRLELSEVVNSITDNSPSRGGGFKSVV